MVGGAGNAPVALPHLFFDTRFIGWQPEHFPAKSEKFKVQSDEWVISDCWQQ
jgi:hypothetical protein